MLNTVVDNSNHVFEIYYVQVLTVYYEVMLTLLYVKSEQNKFGVDTYNDPFLALDNFKTHLYDLVA